MNKHTPSPILIHTLEELLETLPVKRLNRSLRDIFLYYMYHEGDSLPLEFDETVTDLMFLFTFLDKLEDEQKHDPLELSVG